MDEQPDGFRLAPSVVESKAIIGRVTGSSVQLRKRIKYRNSFQVSLRAEIHREAGGSIFVGTVGIDPFVKAFMGCWLIGVFGLRGVLSLASLAGLGVPHRVSTHPPDKDWMGFAIPPLMILFGIALVWFGRYLARGDKRFITDFFMQTLSAKG